MSDNIANLKEELLKRGIIMHVGGCGCCGSPWLKVMIDGKIIVDESEVDLDMFDKETPSET